MTSGDVLYVKQLPWEQSLVAPNAKAFSIFIDNRLQAVGLRIDARTPSSSVTQPCTLTFDDGRVYQLPPGYWSWNIPGVSFFTISVPGGASGLVVTLSADEVQENIPNESFFASSAPIQMDEFFSAFTNVGFGASTILVPSGAFIPVVRVLGLHYTFNLVLTASAGAGTIRATVDFQADNVTPVVNYASSEILGRTDGAVAALGQFAASLDSGLIIPPALSVQSEILFTQTNTQVGGTNGTQRQEVRGTIWYQVLQPAN